MIRQEKLYDLKSALAKAGYFGMTVYEVKGRGRQKGYTQTYRGKELRVDLLPKTKIEMVIDDKDLGRVTKLITENVRTGDIGDGKIFIYPISDVIRIRTGERGKEAI